MTASYHDIVNPSNIDKELSKTLPQLIELHARNPKKELSTIYIQLLCNWIKNLERSHFKTNNIHNTQEKYDERMDRVLMFVRFSREEAHRDGALLMTMWRWSFAQAEVLRRVKKWRIALIDDSLPMLKQIRHPDVLFMKQMAEFYRTLDKTGKGSNINNYLDLWKQQRIKETGKEPGKKATHNFIQKYEQHFAVFNARRDVEKAFIDLSHLTSE